MNVSEIFPSFQGEALLVGVPQVFLRMGGCNLRCSYCDTPQAREEVEVCRVYDWVGEIASCPNPLDVNEAARLISSLWEKNMHSVSVTGGEPLLQASELARLFPVLREMGMPIYLETNGTLPEGLAEVLPWVEWVAMDVKLPSSQEGDDLLEKHRRFLSLASSRRVFLKVVVEERTTDQELERFCRELAEVARGTPLVLQPVTPRTGARGITVTRAHELHRLASAFFPEARVIFQALTGSGLES